MKLILVGEQSGRHAEYIIAASKAGWYVAGELEFAQVEATFPGIAVDAAVLITRRVNEVVLEALRHINATQPLPVVLYSADSLQQSIRAAVSAGVSAYVVDCTNISRLGALLDVAVIRFSERRQLEKELQKAKLSLAERKNVEKAKGIIMRQRRISEDKAYQLLRKLAMDRNRRIGEVAGEVIAAAEVLI